MERDSWLLFSAVFLLVCSPFCNAQLVPTESRILFQVQQFLEYPPVLQSWNNWTSFCFLSPTSSLSIVCSGNRITELTIVGNKSSPSQMPKLSASNFAVSQQTLSRSFSIDSFFTVLTKLTSLQKLSLVSLGLWGPLPAKVNRFRSLQVLNISANFMFGEIPQSISTYQSLKSLVMSDNLFNGSVPDLSSLSLLEELDLSHNHLGPKIPSLGNNLVRISFGNNSLKSEIPQDLNKLNKLQVVDFSSNKLIGRIPSFLFSMPSIQYISLSKNQLTGAFPPNLLCNRNLTFVDISSNLLIGKLPSCLSSNVGNKRVIIMLNCLSNTTSRYQRPSSFCQKDALAVKPPSRNQKGESTLKLGIVVGIIGCIVLVLGVLGLLILVIYKRVHGKRSKHDSFVIEKNPIRGSPIGSKSIGSLVTNLYMLQYNSYKFCLIVCISYAGHVPQPMRMTSIGLPPYHVFTLEEMEDATNNFDPSNLVGEGSQGQVNKNRNI